MKKLYLCLCIIFMFTTSFAADVKEQVVVFAAASVTNAMDELLANYNKANGTNHVGSYAASGPLARQIKAGSPAAIFISADPKWMDEIEKDDLIDKASRKDYLGNDLVLIASVKSPIKYAFGEGKSVSSLLKKGDKIAIGEPESVPAGSYAKSAFTKLGYWDNLKSLLIIADNVRGVLMFVEREEAALGVVYASDAVASSKVKVLSTFPADSHSKISYPIAIVKGNKTAEAEKFYKYITSPEAKPIIQKWGFLAL